MTLSFWHGVCAFSPENPSVSDHFLPKGQRNPMGDCHDDPLRVAFDRQINLEFHGSTVTSDAGLLAYRELDHALGLTSTAASGLHDTRTGQNTQHSLLALLRQSIYSRLAGYEDVNDAERLCLDPALRIVVGGRAKNQAATSTSEMARFETETLSAKENLKHLMDLRSVDRPGPPLPQARQAHPGHGQFRERDLRSSAGQRLQRPLRLYLLPPAAPLQPVR
jgi:hypothetical protein